MPSAPMPQDAAAAIRGNLGLDEAEAREIQAALEAQRAAPPPSSKPLSQSLTVRAAIANMIVPLLALKLGQWCGLTDEQAWELAATIFTVIVSLITIGARRAMGLVLIALLFVGGCCSHIDSRPLAESYRRWLNGPGRAWVAQAKDDPRFDQSDALDRQARWEIASALVQRYEEEGK